MKKEWSFYNIGYDAGWCDGKAGRYKVSGNLENLTKDQNVEYRKGYEAGFVVGEKNKNRKRTR